MNAKKQLLVVDDDELILSCLQRTLGQRFTLETALGGEQAITALTHGSFAVIASDLRMPGTNGIELLRKVKESDPDTIGILLTGNPELDAGTISASNNVFFKVLMKPCPTPELIATIEEALEQYRLNSEAGVQ